MQTTWWQSQQPLILDFRPLLRSPASAVSGAHVGYPFQQWFSGHWVLVCCTLVSRATTDAATKISCWTGSVQYKHLLPHETHRVRHVGLVQSEAAVDPRDLLSLPYTLPPKCNRRKFVIFCSLHLEHTNTLKNNCIFIAFKYPRTVYLLTPSTVLFFGGISSSSIILFYICEMWMWNEDKINNKGDEERKGRRKGNMKEKKCLRADRQEHSRFCAIHWLVRKNAAQYKALQKIILYK